MILSDGVAGRRAHSISGGRWATTGEEICPSEEEEEVEEADSCAREVFSSEPPAKFHGSEVTSNAMFVNLSEVRLVYVRRAVRRYGTASATILYDVGYDKPCV
jgi:hypothetical protein